MNMTGVIGEKRRKPERIARPVNPTLIGRVKRFRERRNGTRKTIMIAQSRPRIRGPSVIGMYYRSTERTDKLIDTIGMLVSWFRD
jgi:hypothetical protein